MADDLKEKKMAQYANTLFIGVFAVVFIVAIGTIQGANWLLWGMGILNLLFGPICLILYLLEIRKGIFNENKE
jgi:hypothetical protein